MSRVEMRRPSMNVALVVALVIGLVGFAVPPAFAASEGQYANAWSSTTGVQWFPLPPSSNALGASDSFCVGASSQPGQADAFFTFPAFSIPGGDTIDGIEVVVDYRTAGDQLIQLTDAGVLTGSEKSLPINDGPSTCDGTADMSVGGAADLWGRVFTPADFNGGSVGVRIKQKLTRVAGDPGSLPIDIDSIQLTVYHGGGGSNEPPTAEANGPYSVPEGGSVVLSSAGSMDPDGDPLTFDWDLDNNGSFETSGASPTFSAAGRDGPDSQTVVVRVSDASGSDTDTATVNITNVAPTINSISVIAASINEGNSVRVSGTFSDPGTGETHTGTALWSDGASTSVTVGGGRFFTDRSFPDDHPATATASDAFTVDITIDDGDGGSDTATSPVVTVNNVNPAIGSIGLDAASISEGDTVTVSGSFSDPALGVSTETFVGSAAWSDGPSTAVAVGAGTYSTSRTFLDDDPTGTPSDSFTVDVTIVDDDTGSDTATSPTVTVNNVAPVITSIASSATLEDKAEGGETVTVSGSFTDVGVLDTHVASVDWGDGNVTPGTVVQGAGSGTYTADHTYASGGVYTVTVTITDDDTGSTNAGTQAVMTGVGINGGVLQIVGTADDDHVEVFIAGGEVDVFASFMEPGHTRFDPADVDSVEIWLCEGDDHGNVHQSITVDAVIHGDDGVDMLWGGDGDDFIEGGDGNDMIWGRRGDDELHGNDGNDRLTGGEGLDILDGGSGTNVLKQ